MSYESAVVIPAYNEERTLARTVHGLRAGDENTPIVIVDNASTDNTGEIALGLGKIYPGIHVLHEATKGTGNASRAGFDYAIQELRVPVVARTDADTVPRPAWTGRYSRYLAEHPHKQLVTGPTGVIKDALAKPLDPLMFSVGAIGSRLTGAIRTRSMLPLKFATGANMAVRVEAYQRVGGFPKTDIADCDEDVILSGKILSEYGHRALGYDFYMRTDTSMRRIRALGGFIKALDWYPIPGQLLVDGRRQELSNGDVDVR